MRSRPNPWRRSCVLLLAAMVAGGGGSASANPPPLPEDFLEYLGSWAAEDGDWLVANAATATAAVAGDRPVPVATRPVNQTTTAQRDATSAPAPGTERKP